MLDSGAFKRFFKAAYFAFSIPLMLAIAAIAVLSLPIKAQTPVRDTAFDNAAWVAQKNKITKINVADGTVLITIPRDGENTRLSVDLKRSVVWAYGDALLTQYDFKGNKIAETAFPETKHGEKQDGQLTDPQSAVLKANAEDGTVWLVSGEKYFLFTPTGALAISGSLNGKVVSLSFDTAAQQVWIVTNKGVTTYTYAGAYINPAVTGKIKNPTSAVFENVLGQLWVAGNELLCVFTRKGDLAFKIKLENVRGMLPDGTGGVWVAQDDSVIRLDGTGTLLANSGSLYDDFHADKMAVDPRDHSLWVATEEKLLHLTPQLGEPLSLQLSSKVVDLDIYADIFPPVAVIASPVGGYQKTNQPEIHLTYGDTGSGVDVATLSAMANGAPVALSCQFNAGDTVCVPAAALPEGLIHFAITVKDFAANVSNKAETSFTVDTVAPVITLASPVNGRYTNQPAASVAGSVSEAVQLSLKTTVTGGPTVVIDVSSIPLDPSNAFAKAVTLLEGTNRFDLTATDLAGNVSTVSATVVLDTAPPPPLAMGSVFVSQPVGGMVTVTGLAGSAEAGSTVILTNTTAGIPVSGIASPDGSFSLLIAAIYGNKLSLKSVDAAGNSSPSSTTTVNFPLPAAPFNISASSGDGQTTVSWDAVLWADSYTIYWSTAPGVTRQSNAIPNAVSPFTHTGLTNGTTYYYAVAAVNATGEGALSAESWARPLPPAPAAPANLSAVAGNAQAMLTWDAVPGAASYNIYTSMTAGAGKSGTKTSGASSPFTVSGLANGAVYYFTVSAENLGGEGALSAEVSASPVRPGPVLPPDPATVAPPNDLTKATDIAESTAFLYTGPNAIQQGVAPGTIEARRVTIIRGKVITRDSLPLPAVTVTVKDHPEFGSTMSRADGMYDMAVNGGGIMTLKYDLASYLSAQRNVDAPWRDFALVDDVALIQLDPQVTTLDLANATTIQVAQGSVVTDADGTRQATMVFQPGTTATMVLPDGTTQPLTTLNVRATEFTVGPNGPKAMPGSLPGTSAYTYAVDISSDEALAAGAKSVRFSQPVYYYLDNFLNIPTGAIMPVGYFNSEKGAWEATENGSVMKVLSVNPQGQAELDIYGKGTAATAQELALLGMNGAERQTIAVRYSPGATFWRIQVSHFSPYDINLGPFCIVDLLTGQNLCEPYREGGPQVAVTSTEPSKECGTVIDCENRTFGESIGIAGTPYSLNYKSDYAAGKSDKRQLHIPLTGPKVAFTLKTVELNVSVAGRVYHYELPAKPNLVQDVVWDGLDIYGRPVFGQVQTSVDISYRYKQIYYGDLLDQAGSPSSVTKRFMKVPPPVRPLNSFTVEGRGTNDIVSLFNPRLESFDMSKRKFGGWTLNINHTYDSSGKLYRGDGDVSQSTTPYTKVMKRIAGQMWAPPATPFSQINGTRGDTLSLSYVWDIATGPDGSVYFEDACHIVRITPDGFAKVVAGQDACGSSGDGGPATAAQIGSQIVGLTVTSDGSIYFAYSNRVRKVDKDGNISTVAGNGTFNVWAGYTGRRSGNDGNHQPGGAGRGERREHLYLRK